MKDSTLSAPSNSQKYMFGNGEVKQLLATPRRHWYIA
jgi:hypothetical protein